MRVLFLAHRIPYPPNKGDKIRSFHQLLALTARGHEVRLLAFADEPRDLAHQGILASMCAEAHIVPLRRGRAKLRALANLPGTVPLSLGYFDSHTMRLAVQRELRARRFDALFVSSSVMAQYVPPEASRRTVVDMVDVDSEKWQDYARRMRGPARWLYQLESGRLRGYEHEVVSRFARTIVTTELEAALLAPLDRYEAAVHLDSLTNGVDLDYYRPPVGPQSVVAQLPANEQGFLAAAAGPKLVFIGCMDYYPNADGARYFVHEVLPSIHRSEPRTEFLIVGSDPTRDVRQLGEQTGVTVTGYVEDVRPYLAAATVCVVPLRVARGVQNKILEAMASGRAIVATPEAVAGLRVVGGQHLLVANQPHELAAAVLELLHDEQLRLRLGSEARRFVEQEHSWTPLNEQLANLVESVAQEAAGFGREVHSGRAHVSAVRSRGEP